MSINPLTTNADYIAGSSSNDIVVGLVDGTTAANNTYNSSDQIDGGDGSNTIRLTAQGGALAALPAPSIKNMQVLDLRAVGTGGVVADVTTIPGLKYANTDRSTQTVQFDNLATGATLGVIGDGTVVVGNVAAGYATLTDDAKIDIFGGVGVSGALPTISIATSAATNSNVANATITSAGATNKVGAVDLSETAASVKTLTVVGDSSLTATLVAADYVATGAALTVSGQASKVDLGTAGVFKTIDASGMTFGGLTVGLDAVTTSFKGGVGNDVVTTAATTNAAAVIDAAAGTADVLNIAAANDITTAAKGAQYTNFEVLRLNNSQDVSLVGGITALQLNGMAGKTVSNISAAQAADVTVRGDLTGTTTLSLTNATGTADVVNLKLVDPLEVGAVKGDLDITDLRIAGVETLGVALTTGGTDLTVAGSLNSLVFGAAAGVDKLTSIVLSGDRSLDLDLGNMTKAITLDTAGMTGSGALLLKNTGTAIKGSVINATANADDITTTGAVAGTTGEFVTYNAGAGNDAISSTLAAVNNTAAGNASLKIDGGTGTDTLTLTGGSASIADANFRYLTNIEKFAATNATGISVTTGGFFDANNKSQGAEFTLGQTGIGANTAAFDGSNFSGATKLTLTTAGVTGGTTVLTGDGADTISVAAAGTTTATVSASGGAGNDSITVSAAALTTGTISVNGGAGQDTISLTNAANTGTDSHQTVVTNAGQSTLAAPDAVTGFTGGTVALLSSTLDFDNVAVTAYGSTAVTGFTAAELSFSVAGSGLLSFTGTLAAGLTDAQKATYAQSMITTNNGDSAFWVSGTDTYIFNNDTAGDSLVKLASYSASTNLVTVNAAVLGNIYLA